MQRRGVIEPEQPVNYALLSLFQYIASVLVIMVHCQRLFPSTLEARASRRETDSVY